MPLMTAATISGMMVIFSASRNSSPTHSTAVMEWPKNQPQKIPATAPRKIAHSNQLFCFMVNQSRVC